MPEEGLDPNPFDDDVIVAPAVDGRFVVLLAELRLSRLLLASSGDDFLCEGDGSVVEPDASGGKLTNGDAGDDESEIAASEPRLPYLGRMGDRGIGIESCRELIRRNQVLDFFSGCRSFSL